mgnify:CR=1 FL=1
MRGLATSRCGRFRRRRSNHRATTIRRLPAARVRQPEDRTRPAGDEDRTHPRLGRHAARTPARRCREGGRARGLQPAQAEPDAQAPAGVRLRDLRRDLPGGDVEQRRLVRSGAPDVAPGHERGTGGAGVLVIERALALCFAGPIAAAPITSPLVMATCSLPSRLFSNATMWKSPKRVGSSAMATIRTQTLSLPSPSHS